MSSPATRPSPFMTLEEAAVYARTSTRTLHRMVSEGRLKSHKTGKRTLILHRDLDAFILGEVGPSDPHHQETESS